MSNWQDVYAAPATRAPAPPPPEVSGNSLGLLRVALRANIAVNLGLVAVTIWSALAFDERFHAYQQAALGVPDIARLNRSDDALAISRGSVLPLIFLAVLALALWTWSAQSVARQIHPYLPHRGAWAFFVWFIPIAGLLVGVTMLTGIWRAADNDSLRDAPFIPAVVGGWLLVTVVAGGLAAREAVWSTYWAQGDESNISHAADLASTGYWLVTAVAIANIILVVTMTIRLRRAAQRANR